MQPITTETVRQLAGLSRIAMTDEDCVCFAKDLQGLCALAKDLETEPAVPSLDGAVTMADLRADLACDGYAREMLLAAAPERDRETFLVPRTVEE